MAIVTYLTRGRGDRAKLFTEIRESKRLGPKVAAWLEKNEAELLKHPALKRPTERGGGGSATGAGTQTATAPRKAQPEPPPEARAPEPAKAKPTKAVSDLSAKEKVRIKAIEKGKPVRPVYRARYLYESCDD